MTHCTMIWQEPLFWFPGGVFKSKEDCSKEIIKIDLKAFIVYQKSLKVTNGVIFEAVEKTV